MGIFHEEFERIIARFADPDYALSKVAQMVLQKQGLHITDDEANELVRAIREGKLDEFQIDRPEDDGVQDRKFSLDADDLERAYADYGEAITLAVKENVGSVISEIAPDVLDTLRRTRKEHLAERRAQFAELQQTNMEFWATGIDRLEMLIMIVEESCETLGTEIRGSAESDSAKGIALYGLCVRASRIANEILTLIKAGFADGAIARWRSLHEVGVIATYISENDENTALGYLDHSIVTRYRSLTRYETHQETLGLEPIDENEREALRLQYVESIEKYGKAFKKDYGWAAKSLSSDRVTLAQIEEAIDMKHWRPYFGLACTAIHGGSHALMYRLGSPGIESDGPYASATVHGLGDPGQCTVGALALAAIAFLTNEPDIDRLVICEMIQLLTAEACESFAEAENRLEESLEIDLRDIPIEGMDDVEA